MNPKQFLALAGAVLLAGCTSTPAPTPYSTSQAFTPWLPTFAAGASLATMHAGNLASNPNCVGQNVTRR